MKKNFGEGIALGIIIGVSVSMIVLVTVVLPEYKKSVTGDGRKILIIELTRRTIHLIEGEHIESVDREYNRFPS